MMTPTAISQIVEQLLRVIVMLGAAAILLPYEAHQPQQVALVWVQV